MVPNALTGRDRALISTATRARVPTSCATPPRRTALIETDMANTTSAKKAARKIVRRTAVNKNRRSRMRNFVRKVEEAISSGDQALALAAFRQAEPELMRAAQNGIVHRNNASRKVSRLSQQIAKLG